MKVALPVKVLTLEEAGASSKRSKEESCLRMATDILPSPLTQIGFMSITKIILLSK